MDQVQSQGGVLICMGTRPEIIKMAPVYQALEKAGLTPSILHTGQHEEMAWPLYEFFGMRPSHIVNLSRTSTALSHLSARLLEETSSVLTTLTPRAVLVHGDTSSTLNAALAAFYLHIPVGHVEAGLRSGSMYDPFPEEMNRSLVGRIAHWHFAPTRQAAANLQDEGVSSSQVHVVGNTIVDAALWGTEHLSRQPGDGAGVLPEDLRNLPYLVRGRRLVLVTAHRRENWDRGIAQIATGVRRLLETLPELVVVWPVHANRTVSDTVYQAFADMAAEPASRLCLCAPCNYAALLWVLQRAWLTMTDSGGIQEEAIALKVPVFVLRETTERPELLQAGGGVLVGADADAIQSHMLRLLADPVAHEQMRQADNPFGDGRAAQYIAAILGKALAPRSAPVVHLSEHLQSTSTPLVDAPRQAGLRG